MVKRDRQTLQNDLVAQMVFLKTSCDTFDTLNQNEALRMAVTLRVLFHDTPQSSSLLNQLGVKDEIQIEDSSLPSEPQVQANGKFVIHGLPGLVGIGVSSEGGKFIPPLSIRE